jgi:glutathione peroxidase
VTALHDIQLNALDGTPLELSRFAGRALLVVNVASECGLTPQYEGLQRLHERFGARGLSVLGVPCNQFGEQEPGTAEEIATFCSANYHVGFTISEKLEVNGPGRHPLYRELVRVPDAGGNAGDIEWNFEKFLVCGAGEVLARWRPAIPPDSDEILDAIERILPIPAPRAR